MNMDTNETLKTDSPKLPDMICHNRSMCGDHPSVTKTELNAKEAKPGEKETDRERKPPAGHGRVPPTASQSERPGGSEHALRLARQRARSLGAERAGGRHLLHAALGSFRWPPYLLGVWVCVVLLTHALHCTAALLDRALPPVRAACQYFRSWTEASWAGVHEGPLRVRPLLLTLGAALLYALYGALLAAHALALWAIEPLCADQEAPDDLPRVTDYLDEGSSLNMVAKQ